LVKFHLESGYIFQNYVVVSEKELFHQESSPVKYKSNFQMGTKIKDINKLHPGDYIVHVVHGIGQYKGLKTLIKNNVKKDYLTVEYKGGDKLYIPVEKIDLISKYSSNESIVPKINKLGGTEWEKTKLRVKKKLENIAGELLKLYAAREASRGIAFLPDDENQTIFESEFPYDETKDQLRVMDEIKHDMESIQPMDRLVCGDVGYGKTELAFRAMFKAVLSGYQVAYLCPTTILSDQHYKNAIARFQSFPVRIKILNRFVTPKEVKNTLEGLQNGTVDIVIGTHRLLSDDVVFKNLGLLIVDEEQRFGVKHKEKIKQLKKNIDILTLSATPIPRTLQMSMTGIRNLSLLETPPVDRFPIQTYVLQENNAIIKDALYKELARNGQSFILYNSVENMETKKLELERLVPDARIVSAHGQMSKTELETIMKKFVDHEYDILLCTTIIETGIDIPNVNTLLIMDADRFGLSQLYQIRGRVGRSNKIAYCYLMYTPGKVLSDIANKRLQVIKEFTELGSGFSIAMRDLSIRGAGDILGSEQAGYIDSVGIELYLKMLNEEVDKLKGVSIKEEMVDEQPLIDVATSISDDYVDSTDIKIYIHQEINSIDSFEKLQQVKEEIEDRFGKITDEMLIYMYEEWFEKLAHALGITQIRQTNNFIEVLLPTDLEENLDGEKLFLDILSISRMFRFGHRGKNTLIILDTVKLDKHFIYYLIDLMNAIMKAKKN
jgi:transcription-repair coupling factor (superfamily II helicase)